MGSITHIIKSRWMSNTSPHKEYSNVYKLWESDEEDVYETRGFIAY